MAVRKVLQLGHPNLRRPASIVTDPTAPDVKGLVADLADTLSSWRASTGYGRAIAAPQIDVPLRVIFLNIDRPWPLINPEITACSEERIVIWDGCLSFLFIFMEVERAKEITVRYHDLAGQQHQFSTEKDLLLAELLQHEIDHLDGILALDRIIDIKSIISRQEFELRYKEASPYSD